MSGEKLLRVSKIVHYVVGKLPSKVEPESIQITCNGEILKLNQTLLTVKNLFWKQSEDMIVKYRFHPDKKPSSLPNNTKKN